jgi:hypothetical protein
MYNTARRLNGARLYINCAGNTWYQNDIEFITDLIKSHRRRRRLRIVGISMGGYAAVLWGCIFPFARTISFSPNLILKSPYTHSWYYRFNPVRAYTNTITILLKRKPENLDIFFGQRDIIDMYYYGLAKNANIPGVHAIDSTHSTAAHLNNNGLLDGLLSGADIGDELKKHIVHPDPEIGISRYKTYCDSMQSLSSTQGQSAPEVCTALLQDSFRSGIFRKLAQDLLISGFLLSSRRLVTYCSAENLLPNNIVADLDLLLSRRGG